MGAWGYNIRQDDSVLDVIDSFESHLRLGQSIPDATSAVLREFQAEFEALDESHLLWLGLADAQWTYGALSPEILAQVRQDYDSDKGLATWREQSEKDARRRTAALKRFIEKLSTPNPRPRRTPKLLIRKPKFQSGDCLSVELGCGMFGAALVLATDHSKLDLGKDLVVVLNYFDAKPPKLDVFEARNWLRLTHHNWNDELDIAWYLHIGFREMKPRIKRIGNIAVNEADPQDSSSHTSWLALCEQVAKQSEWDSSNRAHDVKR